jgi:hypothetical protein
MSPEHFADTLGGVFWADLIVVLAAVVGEHYLATPAIGK